MKAPSCSAPRGANLQGLAFTVAIGIVIAAIRGSFAQNEEASNPFELQARRFVERMQAGEFEALTPLMDRTMNAALPPEKLKATCTALEAQMGAFKEVLGTRREDRAGYRRCVVTCSFEKGKIDATLAYDAAGLVAGLFFAPAGEPKKPPYADPAKFREEETAVVTGEFRLPATLTIPVGARKPPVAVLVHGSGPNDRDETIGPNKVFRDLAWGLAMHGIASLRYEKRTRAYGPKLDLKTLTHREETVEDAVSAVRLAAGDERLDGGCVVLIGHSLGGLLAPLIASEAPQAGAVALMAGSNRPHLKVMAEQLEYIALQDGKMSEEERRQLDDFRQAALDLLDGKAGRGLLTGVTKLYIERLNQYDSLAAARSLKVPILVAQGERDYQVLASADFENWKHALSNRPRTLIKLYPDLDHLFMSGSGKSYPSDYATPRNVSEKFIADVADWILALRAAN